MEQNFNHVLLCGQVLTQPQPSHVNHSQSFSRFLLSVPRLSGQEDCLPVIVPQPLLELCPLSPGAAVTVTGQLRSFNNRSGQGPRLVVSVFAQTLQRAGRGGGDGGDTKPRQMIRRATFPASTVSGVEVKSRMRGSEAARQPRVPAAMMAALRMRVIW